MRTLDSHLPSTFVASNKPIPSQNNSRKRGKFHYIHRKMLMLMHSSAGHTCYLIASLSFGCCRQLRENWQNGIMMSHIVLVVIVVGVLIMQLLAILPRNSINWNEIIMQLLLDWHLVMLFFPESNWRWYFHTGASFFFFELIKLCWLRLLCWCFRNIDHSLLGYINNGIFIWKSSVETCFC